MRQRAQGGGWPGDFVFDVGAEQASIAIFRRMTLCACRSRNPERRKAAPVPTGNSRLRGYDKKGGNPALPKGFDFQTGGAVSGERVLKQAEGGRRSRSINRILKFDSTSHDEVTAIINVGIAANRGNPELITQHG
jgi:hypothetical protein